MTKLIEVLHCRLKQQYENYESLRSEDLYLAYKQENRRLSNDELDYLMCQAICAMPQHAAHIPLDVEWNLLHMIDKTIDASDAFDPQLEIIAQVVSKRDILNIDNNWFKSVLHVYELIIKKNLTNIHADLAQIKHLQSIKLATENRPLLFISNRNDAPEEHEPGCNWLVRDFTTPFFFF